MEPVSLEDTRVIAWQIGRTPRALLGVERRCPHGYPQVVRVHPLMDGKPFPTLFWLSCPFLVRAVSALEAEGWIDWLEARVAAEPDLAKALREAHGTYAAERGGHLAPADRSTLEGAGILRSLTERGIGGIADFSRIKCLHLHVAHALARGNPVGRIVLDCVSRRVCGEPPLCAASRGLAQK